MELPEHLPDLVVPQGGVGGVHDDHKLDLGVGDVAEDLLKDSVLRI